MNTQTHAVRPDRVSVPDALDTPCAKLVYLALSTGGASTAGELADGLGPKKTTLLGVLDALVDRGVVERDGTRYVVG